MPNSISGVHFRFELVLPSHNLRKFKILTIITDSKSFISPIEDPHPNSGVHTRVFSQHAKGVTLIHPPAISKRYLMTKFMPYGMAVIYSFLKEHDVPVTQYDFLMEYLFDADEDIDFHNPDRNFSEEDFFSHLEGTALHTRLDEFTRKYGARIIQHAAIYGFSIVAYHQFWASLLLAKHIKSVNPESIVVFGGPFITIRPAESFVGYAQADYWIKGNGEIPLLMLYRFLRGEKGVSKDEIPGIVYLDGDQLRQSPQSVLAAEEERPPDFEGLPLENYRYDHPLMGKQTLFLPYRISKGCPSRCSFCTGRLVDSYDCKSIEKVVSEVVALARKYDTATFQFADASINGNPQILSEVCDRLAKSFPKLRWYSYAKVSGFSRKLIEKVKKAGCFSLFWGVESAHQATIHFLGKHFEVNNMYQLIDYSVALGIKNYIHLIFNTPHESIEDVEALKRLVDTYINCPNVVFLPQRFLLEPHSLMFDQPDRYGLVNIRKVESSIFEREQYVYQESDGQDYSDIYKRNDLHRRILAGRLESIKYRSVISSSKSRWAQYLSPRLLVYSGKYSERSVLVRKFHNKVLRLLEDDNSAIREQL